MNDIQEEFKESFPELTTSQRDLAYSFLRLAHIQGRLQAATEYREEAAKDREEAEARLKEVLAVFKK